MEQKDKTIIYSQKTHQMYSVKGDIPSGMRQVNNAGRLFNLPPHIQVLEVYDLNNPLHDDCKMVIGPEIQGINSAGTFKPGELRKQFYG